MAEEQPDESGWLVLVVGPSGAGKDTLLAGARDLLAADPRIHFAVRTITRKPDASEKSVFVSEQAFDRAERDGAFALSWRAHGLAYGIGREIEDHMAIGQVVVANVSRGAVADARQRYRKTVVLYVDAPKETRVTRLATRGRESEEAILARIDRGGPSVDLRPEFTLTNDGPIGVGALAIARILVGLCADAAAGPSGS